MVLALALSHALAAPSCGDLTTRLDDTLAHGGSCLTPGLHGLLAEARREGLEGCLNGALVHRGLAPVAGLRRPPRPPVQPPAEKQTRDYRTNLLPYEYETENFVVKWGSYEDFTDADVEALASAFEHGWDTEIDDWGYPSPYGTDTYKFNVYIGDTTSAPSSQGAAGYFYYDGEGWPMIVIAAAQVRHRSSVASTAAHEFFHAVQDAVGTYEYDDQGAWYFEATAVWTEEQIYPDLAETSSWVAVFAYLPHYPLNYFDYPDTGTWEELHQYGAFLYPRHLSDTYGTELIRRSWEEAPRGGDPLVVLDDLLAEEGTDTPSSFFDFAQRNATWDYANGDVYAGWVEAYGFEDARNSGTFRGADDSPKMPDQPPRTYGANYWEVATHADEVVLTFAADDPEVEWSVALVERAGDERTVTPIEITDGAAEVELVRDGDAEEAWVVVAVVDGPVDRGDTYDYELALYDLPDEPEAPEDTGPEESPRACACATGSSAPWILAILPALLLWRRRQRA